MFIEVSYDNHAPIVVAHPDGEDGVYRGLPGAIIQLDASASYDMDAAPHNERAFQAMRPGQPVCRTRLLRYASTSTVIIASAKKGAGRRWDFVVDNSDAARPRSTIAIPVRVCDDGRWNGKHEPDDGAQEIILEVAVVHAAMVRCRCMFNSPRRPVAADSIAFAPK